MNVLNILTLYRDYLRRSKTSHTTAGHMLHAAVLQIGFWALVALEAACIAWIVVRTTLAPESVMGKADVAVCLLTIFVPFTAAYCYFGPMTREFANAEEALKGLRFHRKHFKKMFGFNPHRNMHLSNLRRAVVNTILRDMSWDIEDAQGAEVSEAKRSELRRAWDVAKLFVDVPQYKRLFSTTTSR